MLHVFEAIVPIFLVVAVGYVLTRAGVFRREDAAPLSRFVVKIALPMLVFKNVQGRPASDLLQPVFILSFGGAAAVMFGLAHLYGRLRRVDPARTAVLGIGMSGANSGFVGFPVLSILVPQWAGVAVGAAMLVDNLFILPFTLFLLQRSGVAGGRRSGFLATLWDVVRQPMVIAIVLALLANALGLQMPGPVNRMIDLLAAGSSGVALLVIGGLLSGLQLRGASLDVVFVTLVKLIVTPALVMGLTVALPMLGLPPLPDELRASLVIISALSTYTIVPALAQPYGEEDFATAVILVQTAVSFVTLSAWMVLLGAIGWL